MARFVGGTRRWINRGWVACLLAYGLTQLTCDTPQKSHPGREQVETRTSALTTAITNVANQNYGAVAEASSTYSPNYTAAYINNGDRAGANWGNGGGWNDAAVGRVGNPLGSRGSLQLELLRFVPEDHATVLARLQDQNRGGARRGRHDVDRDRGALAERDRETHRALVGNGAGRGACVHLPRDIQRRRRSSQHRRQTNVGTFSSRYSPCFPRSIGASAVLPGTSAE